jgi:hypothetical protein
MLFLASCRKMIRYNRILDGVILTEVRISQDNIYIYCDSTVSTSDGHVLVDYHTKRTK